WQTLVKDAISIIKKEMETLYKQVPDEIKLCVDNPKELTTELKSDDIISKHFNIDHIEEGFILIYPVPKPPTSTSTTVAENKTVSLECKKKKLKPFSSYRSLKEVLAKYDLVSEGTEVIPLFTPQIHKVPDDNKHLELCMADIKLQLQNYGMLVITSLESMRNEYVSTILYTTLHIAEDAMKKKFSMRPEYEIIGDESSGQVNYAIKPIERNLAKQSKHLLTKIKNLTLGAPLLKRYQRYRIS
ncbi:520_t:CDS:2, partial [Funneliformis caledonium]